MKNCTCIYSLCSAAWIFVQLSLYIFYFLPSKIIKKSKMFLSPSLRPDIYLSMSLYISFKSIYLSVTLSLSFKLHLSISVPLFLFLPISFSFPISFGLSISLFFLTLLLFIPTSFLCLSHSIHLAIFVYIFLTFNLLDLKFKYN